MMQQNNCRLYLKVLLLSKLQITKVPAECGSRRKCGTCAAHCFTPEKGVSAARYIILVRQCRDCKWLIRTDLCIIEDIKPECLVLVLLRQENSVACYLLDCIGKTGQKTVHVAASGSHLFIGLVTPRQDSSACHLLDCIEKTGQKGVTEPASGSLGLVTPRQDSSACYLLDCIVQQGKQVSWWLRAVDLVTPREDSSACYLLDCI